MGTRLGDSKERMLDPKSFFVFCLEMFRADGNGNGLERCLSSPPIAWIH